MPTWMMTYDPYAVLRPVVVLAAGACLLTVGCTPDGNPKATPTPPPAHVQRDLIFPRNLYVKNASVNQFIIEAIDTCVSGDYEAFRLLWSVRQDPPFSEREFKIALRGGAKVTIRRVQKFRTPDQQVVYAVRARVELHQTNIAEPVRDVVLLLVRESGRWRLAIAPSYVRKAMKRAEQDTSAPQSAEPEATPRP